MSEQDQSRSGDPEKPDPDAPLAGRRILVVDDEMDVRIFLTTVLEDHGATTLEAEDGAEAIEIARAEKPDLITLDLSMPGTDGVEAFAKIRNDPEIGETPICIITGHPEFRKVIYSSSPRAPEGYMDKPVRQEEVILNIRKIFETGRHRQN